MTDSVLAGEDGQMRCPRGTGEEAALGGETRSEDTWVIQNGWYQWAQVAI